MKKTAKRSTLSTRTLKGQIRKARADGATLKDVARMFGVSHQYVSQVTSGRVAQRLRDNNYKRRRANGFIKTVQIVPLAIRAAADGDRIWIEERETSGMPAPSPDEIAVAADLLEQHGFTAIAMWMRWQCDDLRFVDHHGDSWTPTVKHPPPASGVLFETCSHGVIGGCDLCAEAAP